MARTKGDVAVRLLEKFLMPIVASAASAAAAYAAKKAPDVIGTAVSPAARSNGHRPVPPDELDERREPQQTEGDRHHTALVYKTYGPGITHPKAKDTSIPDFPGGDAAMKQKNVTEYFKGTVDSDGKTLTRSFTDTSIKGAKPYNPRQSD